MMQTKDKIDQEMLWEPRGGHANLWFDNWTQLGSYKCNTDGSIKYNIQWNSKVFYVRDSHGKLVFAKAEKIDLCDALEVENILDGMWEIPWDMSINIRCIHEILKEREVVIVYTFRKVHNLADFLTNFVYDFAAL
ncbi:hypothetical protein H5410_002075 [Solanum commersonii]|uniref:Uncharacterized protein n=1 Tax=Solanum commersonii TaxID=4109 RepID=A0A9J6B0V2_SOLCO|nr:hypothetical protein H5410_002075 [Solanum commersonii]